MKQYIILVSLVVLGIFIYKLVVGLGEGSILGLIADMFRGEIERMSN